MTLQLREASLYMHIQIYKIDLLSYCKRKLIMTYYSIYQLNNLRAPSNDPDSTQNTEQHSTTVTTFGYSFGHGVEFVTHYVRYCLLHHVELGV